MARIALVTSGHFCTNPRVWREADVLSRAGHAVTVIGVAYDQAQNDLDRRMLSARTWRYEAAANLTGDTLASLIALALYRLRSRIGKEVLTRGIRDANALGYAVKRLLSTARRHRADLTIVHLEPALWVGAQLLREGFRVGVDLEDWYSENDKQPGKAEVQRRAFLRLLEGAVLRNAAHSTTTSRAMAAAACAEYGCKAPGVIYNSIFVRPFRPGSEDKLVSLIWFSQTLGAGRGIEDLCLALPLLQGDWRIEIRAKATSAATAWLRSLIPTELWHRMKLEPTVPPDELSATVARHDIGLALEVPDCRNKDLTASNKLFEYLQSGLSVVASDTAGQREILRLVPDAGELYPPGDYRALASAINRRISARNQLRADRARIHRLANETLAYEVQAGRLLRSVDAALGLG